MRLAYLDALRCLAVMAVVAQHYIESVWPKAAAPFLAMGPGVFGVALFFMISGYVIPFSLNAQIGRRGFLVRRLFRILPMYWVTLAFIGVLGFAGLPPYAEVVQSVRPLTVMANGLLVFEYIGAPALLGVAWSLSLEFVWYALFAVLFLRWGFDHADRACLLYSAALVALSLAAMIADQRLPFGRLLMLNAALLGYARFALERGRTPHRNFLICNLSALIAGLTALWVGFEYFDHPRVSLGSNLIAWGAAYSIFTIACSSKLIRDQAVLRQPMVTYLGLWSYSIYLLHEPIRNLLAQMLSGWFLITAALASTTLLAALAYRWIETPFVDFSKQIGGAEAKRTLNLRPSWTKLRSKDKQAHSD